MIAKIAPTFARLSNLFAGGFVFFSAIMIFSWRVCETDRNLNGARNFYPSASAFLGVQIFIWPTTCIVGTLFNAYWPRDTSFYNPPTPTDKDDSWTRRTFMFCYAVVNRYGV